MSTLNDLIINGILKIQDMDTTTNSILSIGNILATKIQIGSSTIDTEIKGSLLSTGGIKLSGDFGSMMGSNGTTAEEMYGKKQLLLENSNLGGQAGWFIGNQSDTSSYGENNHLYFQTRYYNGDEKLSCYIQDNAKVNKINNPTQITCAVADITEFYNDVTGLIVEANGNYMNFIKSGEEYSQISSINIDGSVPIVNICKTQNSKKILGVISNPEQTPRRLEVGAFVSFYNAVTGDNRIIINNSGVGAMWVSNTGGNLETGDYICASGTDGYGMKQSSTTLQNYTVAKITMDCDFNPTTEKQVFYDGYDDQQQEIIWSDILDENNNPVYSPIYQCQDLGGGVKIALVGCVFLCG